ncbi:S-adenosylmethionine:tRNA ribosyltransferase-isomerase [uncultured Desulfobacterium sp.]|uniref:S-adenosylmethionine:tRNA ribosyltransferase-isomerase n=1 Tax=uncultured Desulfobacterium sp. TaxID=201089 RepID=A0A445MVA2_9BACT|nr:S-adenosylmethionine:tRNA ribosyltransferase-isomerase [uncultured Desulfobacterium sp.]
MFDTEDYDYDLPADLIAHAPAHKRDHSRLLVIDRKTGAFRDKFFFDLPVLLASGDLIVVNDTRVVPARLYGRKESGGLIEILVLDHPDGAGNNTLTRSCLLKSSKRPRPGSKLFFDSGVLGRVDDVLDNGLVSITFSGDCSVDSLMEEKGQMPLPPYIKRQHHDPHSGLDRERYQTVYSRNRGAVAAPTAGLHFTQDLIARLAESEISLTYITLHVGYGTFRPVRTKDIRKHDLDSEQYRIGPETASAIERTKKKGGRVIAVGTTVVRTLETAANPEGGVSAGEGRTNLLITPGFTFKVVDALITNFHLPKSSLLFLVSAFAGLGLVKEAYIRAIENGYRFYSYGDAMLAL